MEPSVSVPTAAGQRPAATAAAEPELEPDVLRSRAWGFKVSPPRALQPLVDRGERILAHSLRLVLPRTIAPARRSRRTRKASPEGRSPAKASDPAVVAMRPAVSMLSLSRTGTPRSGPRGRPSRPSRSRVSASAKASGFVSITDRRAGPRRSTTSTRARHCSTRARAVKRPESRPDRRASIPIAAISEGGISAGRGAGPGPWAAAAAPPASPARRNRRRLQVPFSRGRAFSSAMTPASWIKKAPTPLTGGEGGSLTARRDLLRTRSGRRSASTTHRSNSSPSRSEDRVRARRSRCASRRNWSSGPGFAHRTSAGSE